MIDIKLVIYILLAVFTIGGAIVSFFVMQKGQNMKINQLEKDITDLKRKQSDSTAHQIETEGLVREINVKLEHIMISIDDLKKNGNT